MIPIQKGAAPIELELKIKEVKATPDTTLRRRGVVPTTRFRSTTGTSSSCVTDLSATRTG